MTGVAVSREWSNYLKTPWVNNVKSDSQDHQDHCEGEWDREVRHLGITSI